MRFSTAIMRRTSDVLGENAMQRSCGAARGRIQAAQASPVGSGRTPLAADECGQRPAGPRSFEGRLGRRSCRQTAGGGAGEGRRLEHPGTCV